jgi:hypothetical protein
MPDLAPIQKFEIREAMTKFLPSQKAFIFAPERFTMVAGGYASGKTRAGVTKGLLLSAVYPGNVGMILRYRGTDLEESTIPVFFEVCPPSWIKSYNKKSMTVVLRNGSVIMFRHLHDAHAQSKTRRVGANLGWFFIDQAEETQRDHWNAMISRLRLPRVPKKFGFGALNPAGHDWIWEDFFPEFKNWPKDAKNHAMPINGKFFQAIRPTADMLGIAVNSEENKESNGGFVEDKYFESLLNSYGQEYIDRFVYCTFEDFQGKIYKEYVAGLRNDTYASIHNIQPFPIPRHWPLTVGIDVGGDSPWAVIPEFTDDDGNQIVVDGLVKRTAHSGEIVRWIKTHLPWNEDRTTFVIDWENRVAMMDLADQGIHCQIARKDVKPGIIRTQGYFHVNPTHRLPEWYESTQPRERYLKFLRGGAPRTFVFNTFLQWRIEHDKYHWDQNKIETPFKSATERFDSCDGHRYVVMTKPEPGKWDETDRDYEALAKIDPLSVREMQQLDKRIADRMWRRKGGAALREADLDEVIVDPLDKNSRDRSYDWAGQGEL